MSISDFIARCDRYCAAKGISRVTLSKRLLSDTNRLDDLAAGGSDIGVNRLQRALDALAGLEAELSANDTAAPSEAA